MTARIRDIDLTGAALAFCQHHEAMRGATLLHGRQCLVVTGQRRILITLKQVGFEGVDDRGGQNHLGVDLLGQTRLQRDQRVSF